MRVWSTSHMFVLTARLDKAAPHRLGYSLRSGGDSQLLVDRTQLPLGRRLAAEHRCAQLCDRRAVAHHPQRGEILVRQLKIMLDPPTRQIGELTEHVAEVGPETNRSPAWMARMASARTSSETLENVSVDPGMDAFEYVLAFVDSAFSWSLASEGPTGSDL
jgi:hypothetical protein